MVSPITPEIPAQTADPNESETSAATWAVPSRRTGRARPTVRLWEPLGVFAITFVVLAIFVPRITTYLNPTTGDEPFYLMTAISLIRDGDLNECNNYIQHDEAAIYPSFYGVSSTGSGYVNFPADWRGWPGSPFPLPPHPAIISPASRQCSSNYNQYPVNYDNPNGELYSKHGLGLSLLVAPAFAIGGRIVVVFFLCLLGAMLAANVYLLARESVVNVGAAVLTWVAFAFTVPQMPYSFLIFPELPAALLTLYAFRRIRRWKNNLWQVIGMGLCVAFLPWLHYRFAPICVGLAIYYIYQMRRHRKDPGSKLIRNNVLLGGIVGVSAVLLMLLFFTRYGTPWPNGSDHAGINDVAGTLRGAVGLFLDQQWGLFVASPIFILLLVGIILMWVMPGWRRDLGWIAAVSVPYFLVIANYAQWWGEWCPPGRYLESILPLFALPFAISLDNIKGVIYRGIYGVLLLLSLLTMWGFLYQPQWMYNQPVVSGALNGKAELLVHGFPALATALHLSFLSNIDLTGFFPSFVSPYFAYYMGPTYGDAASEAAWRTSFLPLVIIILIIFVSLLLAWSSVMRNTTTGGSASTGDAGGDQSGRERESTQGPLEPAPLPTQNATATTESCEGAPYFGKMLAGAYFRAVVRRARPVPGS